MGLTPEVTAEGVAARVTLRRLSLVAGWVPVVALVPVVVLVGEIAATYRYLPLVASGILFGMPHGAVDYVALPRARRGRVTLREVGIVAALYLILGGTYLVVWFFAPVPAAVAFVLLTWFHWGQGDLYALRDLFGTDHVDDHLQQSLTVVVRGGLPMLVPLFGFPGRYRDVIGTFVAPFGGTPGEWWLFGADARFVLAVGFLALSLLTLARGRRRAGDRRGWRIDAAETGLLWAFFLLVPPVLAVGVYFPLWHSIRHIARVLLLDEWSVDAVAGKRWASAFGKFGLEAAVPTVLALGFVGALRVAVPESVGTVTGLTGLYLVGIAVLTLPHTVVVGLLDREQGIWRESPDRQPPRTSTEGT